MGTNCAPLVADLFCFVMRETLCSHFLTILTVKLNSNKLDTTSIYLDDLLNINNPHFEQMVG